MLTATSFKDWFETVKLQLGNRKNTFAKMFEYLDALNRPVTIIETGCMRKADNFLGDGQSTILFDHYVQEHGGAVYSVDIDPKATQLARENVSNAVNIHTGDSVEYLRELAKTDLSPDLVYLDSLDWMEQDPFRTALHCANEFNAILPAIRQDTLIVCDDTPSTFISGVLPRTEFTGKGTFVAKHAEAVGADLLFNEWQSGWTQMMPLKKVVNRGDADEAIDQLIGRARRYAEAGKTMPAEAAYRSVLFQTRPPKNGVQRVARGEACAFYARLAASVGLYGTAGDWYRDAIISDPRCVDYRLELVLKSYRPTMNWQLARQECIRSTKIEPDNPQAWRILGDIEMSLCDIKRCRDAYNEQLRLAPDDPNAMLDRCTIALDTADYKLCKKLANKVLQTDRKADGYHVLAMIANREGRHEEAIELFDQAIEGGCANINTAHWNKSISLHAIGRYREGWKEHEYRKFEINNPALSVSFQRFHAPLWNKEPPPASILIHAEAGMGDNICCARFFPLLKDYDLRYETHEEMVDLMRRSFPDITVIPRAPDYPGAVGLKPFDYHLPIGSIAHLFDIDIDTVPWNGPYLKPDHNKIKRLKLPKGKNIGLCWSSGIRDYGVWLTEYGRRKSMHFSQMAPIAERIKALGHNAINLQVGPEREQQSGIYDVMPTRPTWDDTAALVQKLDLVITVDTAVAHLAGALGKPTWVLAQRDAASWHLMCWRHDFAWNKKSPWYPSFRIFRQHQFNAPHFWNEVVQDIIRTL